MVCLFRPGIQYWLFQTLTGLTGVTLYTIVSLIFVFAHPLVRKKAFNFFWLTHQVLMFINRRKYFTSTYSISPDKTYPQKAGNLGYAKSYVGNN